MSESIHQEVIIDIHVRHLKIKLNELQIDPNTEGENIVLPVRIVWSRGKKVAKTQYKNLSSQVDMAVFDEKFQINTVLELDPNTQMPSKEKTSKLTVALNKENGYKELAEVEFDMADYKYGKYNGMRLFFEKCKDNDQFTFDPAESYIEIGIKGTKADGLVQQRMSAIKEKMANSLQKSMLSSNTNQPETPTKVLNFNFQNQSPDKKENFNYDIEKEKFMKEKKEMKKEYEKQLAQKSNKINDLLTDLQNQQTDLTRSKSIIDKISQDNQTLQEKYAQLKIRLEENEKQIEIERKNRALIESQGQLNQQDKAKQQNLVKVQDELVKAMQEKQKKDEELRKANERLSESNKLLLSLYSFERFDISYAKQASKFIVGDSKNQKQPQLKKK